MAATAAAAWTVAHTLTNSGTLNLGNGALGAATSVAFGGLVNTVGGSLNLSSSAAHLLTVTVNGPARNAGNIAIGSLSVFKLTGTNAFTQTSGTTTVQGTLSAATIAIDGGTLAVETTSFKNTGTMIAAGGGKIDFRSGGLVNLSGTTLSGGTFIVDAGSTLQLPNNATVTALAAKLTVSGLGSTVQGFSITSGTEVAIESTLTTIAAAGALSVLGERSYTTTNALADSGSLTIGTGSTLTAPSLNVAAGGRLVVGAEGAVNLAAPLTVAGIATNAGTIDGGGPIAVTMASGGGRLILDPGFAFGGKVVGGGAGSVLELAKGSGPGILKTLGANFTNPGTVTVDAGATWTVFSQAAALGGEQMIGSGGSNMLVLTTAGAVNLGGVSGFPTIDLAAGNSTATLGNTSLSGGPVTIQDAASGNNTIDASGVTAAASSPLAYIAGAGIDKFTGGAESDTVMVSRAALAHDTLTGGGGADTLTVTTAGAVNITKVGEFETYGLASGAADSLTLTTANFAGVSGTPPTITVDGGNSGNTLNEAGVAQADLAVLIGGSGADTLIAGQHATLTGGAGVDKFEFTTPGSTASPDIDTITDFTPGTDKIGFSNTGFALGRAAPFPQPLPASLFVANSTGSFTNSTQRFAYNTTAGTLVYGSSGVSPTGVHDLVATLNGHPAVAAADLFVIA